MNLRSLGVLALAITGCNNIDVGLIPLYPIAGMLDPTSGGCTFDISESSEKLLGISMDVANTRNLSVVILTRNVLVEGSVVLERMPAEELAYPNTIRPVRFDYSWECDSHEFLTGLPPLVVPAHFNEPFCYDNQETTDEFVGTEVISVTGSAIPPGGTGGIELRAVSPQTADQINQTFTLARSAEACCAEDATGAGGCYNREGDFDVNQSLNNAACTTLNNQLLSLSFGRLSTAEQTGVETFRPFVVYTKVDGARYPMRLRGVFEGVTLDGSTMNSPDYTMDVAFCAGDAVNGACAASACTDF